MQPWRGTHASWRPGRRVPPTPRRLPPPRRRLPPHVECTLCSDQQRKSTHLCENGALCWQTHMTTETLSSQAEVPRQPLVAQKPQLPPCSAPATGKSCSESCSRDRRFLGLGGGVISAPLLWVVSPMSGTVPVGGPLHAASRGPPPISYTGSPFHEAPSPSALCVSGCIATEHQ